MPRGKSGRIVVDMPVDLKRQLHAALAADGTTLKQWFVAAAAEFLRDREEPRLPLNPKAFRPGRRKRP